VYIPGTKTQTNSDPFYDASGTITTGGTPQLIRPMVPSCSHFVIQNLSSANSMYVEFGSARATAALSSGTISAITVTNGGFGFTYPPVVRFAGGGHAGNMKYLGLNQPGGDGPTSTQVKGRTAIAHAVLTSGVVTSIVIDDPGAGYVIAPYVFIANTGLDPYGCANPFFGSAVSGILLGAGGGSYYSNGTVCTTDPISIYCSASAQPFTFKWMV
jgi:hypothetical protein